MLQEEDVAYSINGDSSKLFNESGVPINRFLLGDPVSDPSKLLRESGVPINCFPFGDSDFLVCELSTFLVDTGM